MEEMGLRAAITKVEEMAQKEDTQIINVSGDNYSTKTLYKIKKGFYSPDEISINSLDSLTDLIKIELVNAYLPLFVRVASPTGVQVFSTYHNKEEYCKRDYLYNATAELPSIRFNDYMDHESFMIALRSKYIETEDTNYLLSLLSKITDKNSVESEDNGLSQTVQAKKGIVMVENVNVKAKVILQPYRTFLEVEQPQSEFLVRLKEGGYIGLFEADGGAWKLEAKKSIKVYLENALQQEINDKNVVVIA